MSGQLAKFFATLGFKMDEDSFNSAINKMSKGIAGVTKDLDKAPAKIKRTLDAVGREQKKLQAAEMAHQTALTNKEIARENAKTSAIRAKAKEAEQLAKQNSIKDKPSPIKKVEGLRPTLAPPDAHLEAFKENQRIAFIDKVSEAKLNVTKGTSKHSNSVDDAKKSLASLEAAIEHFRSNSDLSIKVNKSALSSAEQSLFRLKERVMDREARLASGLEQEYRRRRIETEQRVHATRERLHKAFIGRADLSPKAIAQGSYNKLMAVGAAFGAYSSGTKFLQVANDQQALPTQYASLTGSEQSGTENLKFVRDLAMKRGLDLGGSQKEYLHLLAAGAGTIGTDYTQKAFSGLSAQGQMLGLTPDEQHRATKALNQINNCLPC